MLIRPTATLQVKYLIKQLSNQTKGRYSRFSPRTNPHPDVTPFDFPFQTMSASGMSTGPHPISSTADPAPPAEGLESVTPGASATTTPAVKGGANGDGAKDGKKQKEKKDKKAGGGSSGPLELSPPPEYFAERIKIFDEYKVKYDKWVAGELGYPYRQGELCTDV